MIKDLPPYQKAVYLQAAIMAQMLFVWEFLGMKINLLIAQRRAEAVVVVKFLWVWIAFPVAQISNKRLHADQRVTKYVLRIWGGGANGWPGGGRFKTDFPWEGPDLAVEAQQQQHDEEQDGPQGRQGHHGHSFGVSYEGQAGTCKRNIGGMGERGGDWS